MTTREPAAARVAGPVVVAVTLVAIFVVGRHLWFFSDDWNIVVGYHDGHLLEPFNGHLSLVPVAMFQAVFRTFGLDAYTPFRLWGLAAYGVLGWVVWRYGRERLGHVGGALLCAAVLWNAAGEANVMFPFLLNFTLPVAALVAIWWHVDRADEVGAAGEGAGRHEWWAALWLALALATSGLGIMVVIAVGVETGHRLAVAGLARNEMRRAVLLAVPVVLWGVWYLSDGGSEQGDGTVREILAYAARMVWGGFAALTFDRKWPGAVLAVAYAAVVAVALWRRRGRGRFGLLAGVDGRVLGSFAAPAAFALATAASRIGVVPTIPPDENRYQWVMGAFLLLALVNVLAPAQGERPRRAQRRRAALAAVLAVAVLVNGAVLFGTMLRWADTVDEATLGVRANLWAAEQADAYGLLDREQFLPLSFVQVTAGEYVDAARALGSPLAPFDEAADYGGSVDSRRRADELLVKDLDIALATFVDARRCQAVSGSVAEVPPTGGWVTVLASDRPSVVTFAAFSAGANAPTLGTVPAGDGGMVDVLPIRGRDVGVRYRVSATGGAVLSVCRSGPTPE